MPLISSDDYVSLAIVFMVCWLSLVYARRFKTHMLARRPVVALLAVLGLMTFAASQMPSGPLQNRSWSLVVIFSTYIWFLSYAIVDMRSRHPKPDLIQMGVQQPFWLGSESTPIGKSAAYLLKHLSASPRELAITQIKGVKLLVWMLVLIVIQSLLHRLFSQMLGFPTQQQAVSAFVEGTPLPRWVNWVVLMLDTAYFSIFLAVYGHHAVGVARLAGFRLPRNTCRPLESRTLADFWNRYNFYFKEVMVDFFYVPAFLKGPKKYPRLRMFMATFMAAGIGNFLFHFIRDLYDVHTKGLAILVTSYQNYALYCALLAVGIALSQLRLHAGVKPADTVMAKLRSFFVVWGFVVVLQNFDINMRLFAISDNIRFTASLFGF